MNENESYKSHGYLQGIVNDKNIYCDYGVNDKARLRRFAAQREQYGFDEREVWNLDISFCQWLYEHIMFFREHGYTDTDKETVVYRGRKYSLTELTDKLLGLIEKNMQDGFITDKWDDRYDEICDIWKVIGKNIWY